MSKTKVKKQIIIDMLINIIGTGLPLIALQLIVYPYVAKKIDAEAYGTMQSIMSLVYLASGTLGGALCTSRLMRETVYREQKVVGDYNFLMLLCLGILTLVMPALILVFFAMESWRDIMLILVISVLNYLTLYFEVGFRIEINYRAIFINKLLGGIGYLLGFLAFCMTLRWQYIFICSMLLQAVFCITRTKLIREKICRTALFMPTASSFANLSFASLLNKALTYFDKLLLFPLLGGEAVSIYFAANIFGKLVLQVLEPITNVVLSYLSKEKKIKKSLWKLAFGLGAIFCTVMYIICRLISRPILQFFYPQWVEQAMLLVPVVTLSLCISTFSSILHPFTLKAMNTSKQILFNATGLVVYITGAMLLYVENGLLGCCYALLISHVCKLFVILLFCVRSVHE